MKKMMFSLLIIATICANGYAAKKPPRLEFCCPLNKLLSASVARAFPPSGPGEVQSDPLAPSPLIQHSLRILSGIAVGAVSLLTVWVIIRMMRKTGGPSV